MIGENVGLCFYWIIAMCYEETWLFLLTSNLTTDWIQGNTKQHYFKMKLCAYGGGGGIA